MARLATHTATWIGEPIDDPFDGSIFFRLKTEPPGYWHILGRPRMCIMPEFFRDRYGDLLEEVAFEPELQYPGVNPDLFELYDLVRLVDGLICSTFAVMTRERTEDKRLVQMGDRLRVLTYRREPGGSEAYFVSDEPFTTHEAMLGIRERRY